MPLKPKDKKVYSSVRFSKEFIDFLREVSQPGESIESSLRRILVARWNKFRKQLNGTV